MKNRTAYALFTALGSLLLISPSAQSSTPSTVRTANWAGYEIHANGLTSARATWMVPTVKWAGENGYSAQWVGLGGGTSTRDSLIQAGTEADAVCVRHVSGRCVSHTTHHWAWLEVFPGHTQERINNLSVAPGDTVTTSLTWDNRKKVATFTVCDWRTSHCVTAARSATAPGPTAEIVMERPAVKGLTPANLANFGEWKVLGADFQAAAKDAPITQFPVQSITMMDGSNSLTHTGALDAQSGAFTVSTSH